MSQRFHNPPPAVNVKTRRAFRVGLLRWYRRHRRALPWRGTADPYRVWVSEIMLQQTRVETVRAYYKRWIRALPTLAALARARLPRVLKLWEGLGYYSRARNLHRAARQLRGRVPGTVAELQQLPGIGRYTAGAIASIAFGQRAPVVDGNVARVFTRVFARADRHWELAEILLPERNCGDFNQALMELGALVCLPAQPRCEKCPLRGICQRGRLPARRFPPLRQVTETALLIQRDGRVWLRQRPATGLLAGFWELPAGQSGKLLLTLRHVITNRQITLQVRAGRPRGSGRWFSRRQLQSVAMPTAHRRALNQILSAGTMQFI